MRRLLDSRCYGACSVKQFAAKSCQLVERRLAISFEERQGATIDRNNGVSKVGAQKQPHLSEHHRLQIIQRLHPFNSRPRVGTIVQVDAVVRHLGSLAEFDVRRRLPQRPTAWLA